MPATQPLTPSAAFWLEALDTFDLHRSGPHWESPLHPPIQPTLHDRDELDGFVREAIVIQQFLLELVTRRGLRRDVVIDKITTLLAAQPG